MDEKFAALKKYNFWDGNIPALGYLRKHYTDKIADYVGNKLLTAFLESKMPTRLYGCNLFYCINSTTSSGNIISPLSSFGVFLRNDIGTMV